MTSQLEAFLDQFMIIDEVANNTGHRTSPLVSWVQWKCYVCGYVSLMVKDVPDRIQRQRAQFVGHLAENHYTAWYHYTAVHDSEVVARIEEGARARFATLRASEFQGTYRPEASTS